MKNKFNKNRTAGAADSRREILEGSRVISLVINNIRPAVVSAYPITPQTHIVEDLAKLKADGRADYEYVRAESEFAAASIILGASATGVRTYSATSSQGLLLMNEVVYNIAGLRLPVVMTCANRAISSPINIWNDHSDVMTVRDAGWIQLFAADHQETANLHILAYKLAEKLKIPVMVNVDGYILTHSYEPVIIPSPAQIKKYLPDYKPRSDEYLNPANPQTFGAFFGPAYYQAARAALQEDLKGALKIIKQETIALNKILAETGIKTGGGALIDNGLVEYYGPKNPTTIIVALGSVTGTIKEVLKTEPKAGCLKIKVYRPFPGEEIAKIIGRAKNIAVLEKAISLGQSGPVYSDLKAALDNGAIKNLNLRSYIAGLGGRDITEKMIKDIISDAGRKNPEPKFIG